MVDKILDVTDTALSFSSYEEVNPYFKRVISTLKQMNYSEFETPKFKQYEEELRQILEERKTG